MLRCLKFAAAALLCCAFSAAAEQDDAQFSAEISKLRPDLETIITGGYWMRGDERGSFRLILRSVGFDHITNRVFLQWIRQPKEASDKTIVESTVPIPEVSGWRVTAPHFVLDNKQWKLVMEAEIRPEWGSLKWESTTFTITPDANYKYRIEDSRKPPSI